MAGIWMGVMGFISWQYIVVCIYIVCVSFSFPPLVTLPQVTTHVHQQREQSSRTLRSIIIIVFLFPVGFVVFRNRVDVYSRAQ